MFPVPPTMLLYKFFLTKRYTRTASWTYIVLLFISFLIKDHTIFKQRKY